MTRDDIIRMAREAGFGFMTEKPKRKTHMQCGIDDLERFAALVAAHEREQSATWVGLTEIEIVDIEADELTSASSETFSFARAIENKLREKNGG